MSGWCSECRRPAKVQENGKKYCGIHNPQKKRERAAKSKAEMDKFFAGLDRNRALTAARAAVVEAAKEWEAAPPYPQAVVPSSELRAAVRRLRELEEKNDATSEG